MHTVNYLHAHADGEDLAEALKNLGLETRQLILIPVNNNPYADAAEGGTHWSMLCYRRLGPPGSAAAAAGSGPHVPVTNIPHGFSHWDSGGGHNEDVAIRMAHALQPLIEPTGTTGTGTGAAAAAVVEAATCAQQRNAFDCGVYACLFAEALAHEYVKGARSGDGDGGSATATATAAAGGSGVSAGSAAAGGASAAAASSSGSASASPPPVPIDAYVASGAAACLGVTPTQASAYRKHMREVLDAHRL